MSNDFKTLKSFTDLFEAELVKELLEENDFRVNLLNEYTVSNLPGIAGNDFMMIELQVMEDQYDEAAEFIEDISDAYITDRMLTESHAKLEGHFLLTSGKHSDQYFEKIKIIQDPVKCAVICKALAQRFADYDVDLVVGPAYGAIVLGFEVAKSLGKKFAFTQRNEGKMTFRSGFDISPGMKAIIIEDVTTTGGSIVEVLELLKEHDVECIGVGLLVDRSNGKLDFGVPVEAMLTVDAKSWEPEECPLCKNNVPLTKPGRSDK